MAGISARSLQIRHPRRGARLRGGGRARQANGPRRARTSNFENARRKASAGVHFSFGIGLPFFGAVVAAGPQPAEFAPRGSFRAHVGLTVLAACTATSLQETARLSGAGGVVFAEQTATLGISQARDARTAVDRTSVAVH